MYIKAGAANMAGAWFIHRPVWPVTAVSGLYRAQWSTNNLTTNQGVMNLPTLGSVFSVRLPCFSRLAWFQSYPSNRT